jgi:hypothetical protein
MIQLLMRASFFSLVAFSAIVLAGCVVVNPSNVSVSGFNSARSDSPPATPYASSLQKVIRQQQKVGAALAERDWNEVTDKTNDWMKYTRTLLGYANTSHDPARFRAYCNDLLKAIEAIHMAAARQDARTCQQALRSCDPILDRFSTDFPLVMPAGKPAAPPPQRQPPPPARSAQPPPPAKPSGERVP